MVKRCAFLIVLLLIPTLAFAQAAPPDVSAMARYFPANTILFGATRVDDAYIDQLISASQPAIDMAAATGAPIPSPEDQLNEMLATIDTNLDEIKAWLGDAAAFGATADALQTASGEPQDIYAVLEVADRAGAEAFLRNAIPKGSEEASEGDYTVFTVEPQQTAGSSTDFAASAEPSSVKIAVSDDLMLIYPGTVANPLLTREARLDSNGDFQQAVGALANAPYNALIYVDPRPAGASFPLDPSGRIVLTTAPLAIGSGSSGSTTVLDIAQLPAEGATIPSLPALDPDFARFLPGDASGVIHATDLSGLLESLLALADQMNEINTAGGGSAPVPSEQMAQAFTMFGIALDDDLLSWTTGDYALFFRTEIVDIIASAAASGAPDLSGLGDKFDFGLVIEATDPAKAQALAEKLGALVTMMTANAEGLEITNETIGGTAVTVFSLSAPIDPRTTVDIDFVLGATDDVFFFATRPAAKRIITGDGTLANDPTYIEAQANVLPNPTFLFYADGEGVLTATGVGVIVPLALLGPAIGNVFDNVVAELESESGVAISTPTPAPSSGMQMFGSDVDPELLVQQLQAALDTFGSATVSATVTEDGIYLTRVVFSAAS